MVPEMSDSEPIAWLVAKVKLMKAVLRCINQFSELETSFAMRDTT